MDYFEESLETFAGFMKKFQLDSLNEFLEEFLKGISGGFSGRFPEEIIERIPGRIPCGFSGIMLEIMS